MGWGAGRRPGLTHEQWAGSQQAEVKEKSHAVATTGRWGPPRAAYPRTAGCPSEQCCPETMGRTSREPGLHKTPARGPRLPDMGANSVCTLSMHSLSHALIRDPQRVPWAHFTRLPGKEVPHRSARSPRAIRANCDAQEDPAEQRVAIRVSLLCFHPGGQPGRLGECITSSTLEASLRAESAHSSPRGSPASQPGQSLECLAGTRTRTRFPGEGYRWPVTLWSVSLRATDTLGLRVTALTAYTRPPEKMEHIFGWEISCPQGQHGAVRACTFSRDRQESGPLPQPGAPDISLSILSKPQALI